MPGEKSVTATLRKHNLSNSVYDRWKEQFDAGGIQRIENAPIMNGEKGH